MDARLPLAQETRLRIAQPLYQPSIRENHRLRRTLRELQGHTVDAATRQLAAEVQAAYLDYARSVRVMGSGSSAYGDRAQRMPMSFIVS